MSRTGTRRLLAAAVLLGPLALLSCSEPERPSPDGRWRIRLAAYTALREPYRDLIGRFKDRWEKATGTEVVFEESYQGSGVQSRAIATGRFEADVAALSLEADLDRLADSGLITHDWRARPNRGIANHSVVAMAVRQGNPREIHDWNDLARPGLQVLSPDPSTSGGAMWDVLAIYGAARRGRVPGVPAQDEERSLAFLTSVLRNVTVMDADARASMLRFETGEGDVAITYETEIRSGKLYRLQDYEMVVPSSTISVDNPVAVVDRHAERHGVTRVARAFVDFLFSEEAQVVFTDHGWRSTDRRVQSEAAGLYPAVPDLWTIEQLGGWSEVVPKLFASGGLYQRALDAARAPAAQEARPISR